MTKEKIIDNIARLNSETWRDREEVRMEIGKLLAELKKALEQPTSNDYEYNRGYRDGYDKGNLNGYELRKAEEKKSEDCVSRQAVTDTVENTMVAIKDMKMPKNCVECNHMDLQQAINCQLIYSGCANCGRHPNCPLVEIEDRKVGKWIDYWGDKTEPDGETWWSGCKCSVCGIFIKSYYKYCPNCGAEMVGAENEIN